MEGMIILSISCSHDVVVEHIYSLPGSNNSNWVCSNNSNWVRQGRGFGGSGGGGVPPTPPRCRKRKILSLCPFLVLMMWLWNTFTASQDQITVIGCARGAVLWRLRGVGSTSDPPRCLKWKI